MSRVIINDDGEFIWRTEIIKRGYKARISTKIGVSRRQNVDENSMVVLP